MQDFLVDIICVGFARKIFQQIVDIPSGINYVSLLFDSQARIQEISSGVGGVQPTENSLTSQKISEKICIYTIYK